MADTAAKEALLPPQNEQPLLATDLRLEIKNQLQKQYQEYWQCSPHLLTNKLRILTETLSSYTPPPRISHHFKTILHQLRGTFVSHMNTSSQSHHHSSAPPAKYHLLWHISCSSVRICKTTGCKYHLATPSALTLAENIPQLITFLSETNLMYRL